MDAKSLSVLAELKNQLSQQASALAAVAVKKNEAVVKVTSTKQATAANATASASGARSKTNNAKQSKAEKKKKAKIKQSVAATKPAAAKKPKPQRVKKIPYEPLALICHLPKNVKPAQPKPIPLSNTAASFSPSFGANYNFSAPKWFADGKHLQHPAQQAGAQRPVTVRIGIDFGTAFTKVAVKVGGDKLVIDWSPLTGQNNSVSKHLLPGIVAKTSGHEYCWQDFSRNSLLTNLKLPLLNDKGIGTCPKDSIAFLALVICYTRAAIYRHPDFERRLSLSVIRWELNIGCATEPFDNKPTVEFIRKVGLVAWNLAACSAVTESLIEKLWQQKPDLNGLEGPPEVTPEFIAQIAGYLTSPQLTEGLHLLVDVGAATLDVATFNVVKAEEVNIPIFCAKVTTLGTHYLQSHRHTNLGLKPSWDDSLPIDNSAEFARKNKLELARVHAVDTDFKLRVSATIRGILERTKSWRNAVPNSLAWKYGLPVFVTGGGVSNELFKSAINDAERTFKTNRHDPLLERFRFIPYTTANMGKIVSNQQLDGRLTVAIGLTEDAANIARITPTRDIGDVQRSDAKRPNHESMYEKK